jgi:hypothetical protein
MSCLVFLVAQSFLPMIQSLIPRFATSWFAMNREQVMLQLDMPKLPAALGYALQLQGQEQQI